MCLNASDDLLTFHLASHEVFNSSKTLVHDQTFKMNDIPASAHPHGLNKPRETRSRRFAVLFNDDYKFRHLKASVTVSTCD